MFWFLLFTWTVVHTSENPFNTSVAQQAGIGACKFTEDCQQHKDCENIQDASCKCNLGQCIYDGNPFREFGTECSDYKDCACRNFPEKCFCRVGYCENEAWECHTKDDCLGMEKCKEKQCTCTGNTCEFDCELDEDCVGHFCNTQLGYQCKCEENLCKFEEKPTECEAIEDCVGAGLCAAFIPCSCTNNYCALPWWVTEEDKLFKYCRNDQDCTETILDCKEGDCECTDRKVGRYDTEMKGICVR